eukprot:31241-Pelagococcus_subviridis.AAC.5
MVNRSVRFFLRLKKSKIWFFFHPPPRRRRPPRGRRRASSRPALAFDAPREWYATRTLARASNAMGSDPIRGGG